MALVGGVSKEEERVFFVFRECRRLDRLRSVGSGAGSATVEQGWCGCFGAPCSVCRVMAWRIVLPMYVASQSWH